MSESTWGGIDQSKDRPTCCVCNFRGPDSGSNGPAWLYALTSAILHLRLVVTATVGWVNSVGCFFEQAVYQGLDFLLQHALSLAFYYQYSVTLYRV